MTDAQARHALECLTRDYYTGAVPMTHEEYVTRYNAIRATAGY